MRAFLAVIRVTTHQAKTHLSRLLAKVAAGEEVMILCRDRPAARLVPPGRGRARRRPRVGTITSEVFECPDAAFAPMTREELEASGLL